MLEVAAKVPVFGVGVTPTTYDEATRAIVEAARDHRSLAVTALAVHGLMTAVRDEDMARAVDRIDIVTPDGQPVRWAMNALYGTRLEERVYGPTLTRRLCEVAAAEGLTIFLFGATQQTCRRLATRLASEYPGLRIAGFQADRFREATQEEDEADVATIVASGADIVLVGRGCPRQERWVADHQGRVPAPMVAVGAAFDYLAGMRREPPRWVQDAGLQWLYRAITEPRRLWRRYLVTNSAFVVALARAWGTSRMAALGVTQQKTAVAQHDDV